MPDRIQQVVGSLLDEAVEAASRSNWAEVVRICGEVTNIDGDNPEAAQLLKAAEANLQQSSPQTPPSPTTTPTVSQVLNNGEEEQRSNEGFNLGQAIMYFWRGRLNRLGVFVANAFLYGVAFLIVQMVLSESLTVFWAGWVIVAVIVPLQFGVMCSRLHDIGKPGYWAIPWFVMSFAYGWFETPWSLIVFLAIAIPCICWPGEDGINQWGESGIGIVKYCKRILGMQYS